MMLVDNHAGQADSLCRLARLFGERQWCLATSGNFSMRIGPGHCLITQSGRDKSRLSAGDLMVCDLDGVPEDAGLRPSAETAVHTQLYRLNGMTAAVLHTHSVAATCLSRIAGSEIEFTGYEMQKAVAGVTSHDGRLALPVFENTQDMSELAALLCKRAAPRPLSPPAFLVRGHGLYAWGDSLGDAARHTEGFEFLLAATLHERTLSR